MSGTWAPYVGVEAVELAIVLSAVAILFVLLGMRLETAARTSRPGNAGAFLLLAIWVVSLLAFLIDSISYGFVLELSNLVGVYESYTAPNPVTPLTDASALTAFLVILYLGWRHGCKAALFSAVLGAAAGALIFELPFDLIVLDRIYPPIPPDPILFRLLFLLPLFLVELSTFSLLTLSSLTRVSGTPSSASP